MRFLLAGLIKIVNLSYEVHHFLAVCFLVFPGGVRGPVLIALVLVISVNRSFDGLPSCDRTTSSKVGLLLAFAPIRSLVAGGISRFFWLLQWGARFLQR